MRLRFVSLCMAFTALALVSGAGAARAQSLAIEPVIVQLQPGQQAETLTILNQSPVESSFQVRVFAWSSVEGEDVLTPTENVVVSPPLGTIAPDQRQLIRIVLRQPAREREETYRIWIDQIPAATEPAGIRIALRLSIPIFAAPATRIAPDLRWQLAREGASLVLSVTNHGTRHQTARNLALAAADGAALKLEGGNSPYILAGATRRWTLAAPAGAGAIRLTATTNDGPLDLTLQPQS